MANTPNRGYPYPALTSAPNVPQDLSALATAVDTDIAAIAHRASTTADRPAATVARAGLQWQDPATGRIWIIVVVGGTASWAPLPGTLVGNLKQTVAQNIAGDTTNVAITFQSAELDLLAGYAAGTPSRYTPTVPGWYAVTGGVSFSTNATGYRAGCARKNGAVVTGSSAIVGPSGSNTVVALRETPVFCNGTTDYLEVGGFQSSGAIIATNLSFSNGPSMTVKYLGVAS